MPTIAVLLPDSRGRFPQFPTDDTIVTVEELRSWVGSGRLVKHLFRYDAARAIGYQRGRTHRAFLLAVLLRLLSRGDCHLDDGSGYRRVVTSRLLARLALETVRTQGRKAMVLLRTGHRVRALAALVADAARRPPRLDPTRRPVYLYTNPWDTLPGGHLTHVAGVVNNLHLFGRKPLLVAVSPVPLIHSDVEIRLIASDDESWDDAEVASMAGNPVLHARASRVLRSDRVAFVYERYHLNNYSGLTVARAVGVPFVLEYNGSEIWMHRHWHSRLRYESLSRRIESLNLRGADLIVVASQALSDELRARGVPTEKILVAPNGVDTERFVPTVDGAPVRAQYNLDGKVVIGFIGTFGKWHGAAVLADAYGRLLAAVPDCRDRTRLLMIGDGETVPHVRAVIEAHGVSGACTFVGFIDPADVPRFLAACDILVAPHVPNPDGSEFFGSPTKLFEYMAMGRGIVASRLAQIGEILEHGHTAWLAHPGDAEALSQGLRTLVEQEELRARLGQAARREVTSHYTWAHHTERIIDRLKELCSN